MTGPEMMLASLVKILGLKPEVANEAVANVNGRVNAALVHFDGRLKAIEESNARIERHLGIIPDHLPMIEKQEEAAQ